MRTRIAAGLSQSPPWKSVAKQSCEGRMALTKAEMAERLFLDVGLNKREAKEFVDAFFEVVRDALEKGEQVKLSGFGNFDLRFKNQRPGRNPKTGEEIPISARQVVTFRPGQKLKVRVEAYAGSGQQ
ncbi:MAG TPA: integration host factor subunit alpha [Burkholderiales bacterium]|nr:integration host factor subunit alpha [Burkholderiales bacterium]